VELEIYQIHCSKFPILLILLVLGILSGFCVVKWHDEDIDEKDKDLRKMIVPIKFQK